MSKIKISASLLAAQREMGGVTKSANNPFFKSKYADLTSILKVVLPVLNKHGIALTQPHGFDIQGRPVVITCLRHESGETIESETPIFCKDDKNPQALGSAITYARRYGLQSLLSLPIEDDDGERAMVRPQSKPANPFPVKSGWKK